MRRALLLLLMAVPSIAFAGQCNDAAIWKHVYHPHRLQTVEPCVTVTGVAQHWKTEADGDLHVKFHLDPEFSQLLNARNIAKQSGDLVVEPVCYFGKKVKQADAVVPCKGFNQRFPALRLGQHLRIRGRLVLDTESNHGWIEIHGPVAIEEIK